MGNASKVLKVSLTVNIILLLVVLVIVLVLNKDKSGEEDSNFSSNIEEAHQILNPKQRFGDGDEKVCFSCELGSDVKVTDTLYDEIIDEGCQNRRICCVKGIGKVGGVLHQILRGRNRKTLTGLWSFRNLTFWTNRSDAIHARLKDVKDTDIQWTTDGAEISFQNGVKLSKNRLWTQNAGLYFIYAAITHNFTSTLNVNLYYHLVTKRHSLLAPNGDTVLLMDRNGGPGISGRIYTSFLCGAFTLRKGHEIGVDISSTVHLDKSAYSNFFGMFRIR